MTKRTTTTDPQNAFTLCFVCHRFAHEWPLLFHMNVREWLGDAVYEALAERARRVSLRNPKMEVPDD